MSTYLGQDKNNIKMKQLITFTFICISGLVQAQATLKVEVSADTVKPGELVKVEYTIENGEGKFTGPDF